MPAHASEPGPVFLAGADRSGIGLLGELLERHPRLAITRRVDFWTRYWGRFGDLRDPASVDRCLQALAADRRGKVFAPDRDRLLADLAGRPTYATLFASLQRQRMEQLGKTRWGDKSLGSERYADLILRSFPSARMLHVVRDPRDRYASQRSHRGTGRGGIGAGAAMWRSSARLAERHARRHADRYRIVRYESLVADPERIMRTVCSFIGEPYVPDLLRSDGAPPGDTAGDRAPPGPGPIHGDSVERFRRDLTPREIATLQLLSGPRQLARFGYVRERVELSGPAKVRFGLVDLPAHGVEALLWRPWARVGAAVARPLPRM